MPVSPVKSTAPRNGPLTTVPIATSVPLLPGGWPVSQALVVFQTMPTLTGDSPPLFVTSPPRSALVAVMLSGARVSTTGIPGSVVKGTSAEKPVPAEFVAQARYQYWSFGAKSMTAAVKVPPWAQVPAS